MIEPFSTERFGLFFEKVELKAPPKGLEHLGFCWLWTAYIDRHGYGRFFCPNFPSINGKPKKSKHMLAHRWSTAFWHGIEKLHKLTYDHLCRRKNCVNPWHGSAVTHSDNVARGNQLRQEPISDDPFEELGI